MGLGIFAPGEYVMTYDSVAVGLVTSGGQNLRWRFKEKAIQDTNRFGDTKIDGIYRGVNALLAVTFKEWKPAVRAAIWPWSASGTFDGTLGVIGRLASDVAKVITLTPTAGTPAATAGPTLFTANLAKIAPENDINLLFGPDERDIPVIFELLPYDSSGTIRLFSITQP
jgi:hypothetical protein